MERNNIYYNYRMYTSRLKPTNAWPFWFIIWVLQFQSAIATIFQVRRKWLFILKQCIIVEACAEKKNKEYSGSKKIFFKWDLRDSQSLPSYLNVMHFINQNEYLIVSLTYLTYSTKGFGNINICQFKHWYLLFLKCSILCSIWLCTEPMIHSWQYCIYGYHRETE